MAFEIRARYDRERGAEVVRLGDVDFTGTVSATKQEFAEESDINVIMSKYLDFGVPLPPSSGGMYGDFSEIGDLLDAQMRVSKASEMFAGLPSEVRERFKNDPVQLMRFVSDSKNRSEAESLGLVTPVAPAPVTPVVPPVSPGAVAPVVASGGSVSPPAASVAK